jgi:hypothetical protein
VLLVEVQAALDELLQLKQLAAKQDAIM